MQGHVCYWDGGWRVSVHMAAVGDEGDVDADKAQGHIQSDSELGMSAGMCMTAAEK